MPSLSPPPPPSPTRPRLLPPSASIATALAEEVVRTSSPAASLAAVTGLLSLIGFTRALTTSLNVTLNEIGSEPIQRTAKLVPLLYLAVLGLLWGAWMFELLGRLAEDSLVRSVIPRPGLLLGNVAPLILAMSHFTIILALVPRARGCPVSAGTG